MVDHRVGEDLRSWWEQRKPGRQSAVHRLRLLSVPFHGVCLMPRRGRVHMADADYIIIGSGAGGGPPAANLANRASRFSSSRPAAILPGAGSTPAVSLSPPRCFTGCAARMRGAAGIISCTTTATLSGNSAQQYDRAGQGSSGIPRVGRWWLTVHNAMITVTPRQSTGTPSRTTTGDWSWGADNMYKYFTRLEDCGYRRGPGPWAISPIAGTSALGLVTGSKTWMMWSSGYWVSRDGWRLSGQDRQLVLGDWRIVGILSIRFGFASSLALCGSAHWSF